MRRHQFEIKTKCYCQLVAHRKSKMLRKHANHGVATTSHEYRSLSQNLTVDDDGDGNGSSVTVLARRGRVGHVQGCDEGHVLDPSTTECRLCTECVENAHVRRSCNASQDTLCECNRDFFWDANKELCQRCDLCPHGWGAVRACSPHRNSACRKCSPGTYSSVLSTTLACFPCTDCGPERWVVQQCSEIQDTVCTDVGDGERPALKKVVPRIQAPNHGGVATDEVFGYFEEVEADHAVWPIYSALLGALVLALLAYVVLKRWHCTTPGRSTRLRRRLPPQSKHSDSKGYFRDVCSTKRRVLEILLNEQRVDGLDWRGLAKELGYSHERIVTLETRSRMRGTDNYAKCLLNDWVRWRGDEATVLVLIGALRRLQHLDAITVLLSGHDHCCATLMRTANSTSVVPASRLCAKYTKGSKNQQYPSYEYSSCHPMGDIV